MGFGNPIQMLAAAAVLFLTSALIVLIGIIYMAVSVFVIKAATGLMGIHDISNNYLVLTAAILSGAALMASKNTKP